MRRAACGPIHYGAIPTARIAYQSRHDSNELCIALFQRPDMKFEIKATRPMITLLHEVAALLDRYGKCVSPS
jgi:hypothetical protein